jgi:hypothetical protein
LRFERARVFKADPDIARVIASWGALPDALKSAILAIVASVKPADVKRG